MRDLILPDGVAFTVHGLQHAVEEFHDEHSAAPGRILATEDQLNMLRHTQALDQVKGAESFNGIPVATREEDNAQDTAVDVVCDAIKALQPETVVVAGAHGDTVFLSASTHDKARVWELLTDALAALEDEALEDEALEDGQESES